MKEKKLDGRNEDTNSHSSSPDHLALLPSDTNVVSDEEELDVGLGVLGSELLESESEVKDVTGVWVANRM
jgi:hypothetical protein